MGATNRDPRSEIAEVVKHRSEHYIDVLQQLIQIPSVGSRPDFLDRCARRIDTLIEDLGFESRVLPTPACPMVFGQSVPHLNAPTLLLTSHYDVQPAEPVEAWSVPPFEARQLGDKIIGRGATDAKGNLAALLAALDALRRVLGQYPLNIKLLFDGAEERGSPQLDEFLDTHAGLLKADAVVSFDAGFAPTDHPFIWLGSSGMLVLEVQATGSSKDLHSSRARLAPHAGWRLVHALASLRDTSGRITIQGFYDHVRPPDPDEFSILRSYPWDDSAYAEELGISEFPDNVTGIEALRKLLFEPSLTITGLDSGYTGPGWKEVLPAQAIARLEFRLVPNQTADDIYEKVERHFRAHQFEGITVTRLTSTDPTQSALNSPVTEAIMRAAKHVYGKPVAIKPRHESSGRQATWLAGKLGIAGAITGIGPPNWRGHAPDEFMLVPYFDDGIEYVANVILNFAELARFPDR
ncbi:M20/M25/M40 family metallo-hydrolase [Thermomicrobiaceae bacterium CFH 74404]|uniref:M20/M25/M40 family metallo-hydrolase n=1 Tax=Thermalbibacter longus TaxID=2951981 RepID=A0AA41WF66_9BACT|nr:M20/M25/M40 family metallo-hydrolase [Thermalbibacter longus]MCM8749948.1 M20/M25/M40 family metallo-hydrolase [Thermalbibacter longus]